MLRTVIVGALLVGANLASAATEPWLATQANAEQSQRAIRFCRRYASGWLEHADTVTGLLPRKVTEAEQFFWNARDCAADNYPFLTLVGEVTDDYYLKLIARHILDQEQKYTLRLDSMADDFDLRTHAFKRQKPVLADVIFGAAEYAKDGLIPITEWVGPGPWSKRMDALLRDIWKHAEVDSPIGKVPTDNVEVDGDLLQAMSRMYWLTGDEQYKDWTFKIADLYLFHKKLLDADSLKLRDHGCEIIGGLSEAYVIAAYKDRARYEKYKPELYAVLDFIAAHGIDTGGMMYISVDTKTGKPTIKGISDGFGYVFDAFLTVADLDKQERYREVVLRTLNGLSKVPLEQMEGIVGGGLADQMADSLEGTLNLLNRIPVDSAFDWVDAKMAVLMNRQRPDGIIEGWYGDGNSARTAIMYALHKTQGITASPWRDDVQLGVTRDRDGVLRVYLKTGYPWSGRLRFDRPRHREYLHLPLDYARINQFPEWFTIAADGRYEVTRDGGDAVVLSGTQMEEPMLVQADTPMLMTIKPLAAPVVEPVPQPITATSEPEPSTPVAAVPEPAPEPLPEPAKPPAQPAPTVQPLVQVESAVEPPAKKEPAASQPVVQVETPVAQPVSAPPAIQVEPPASQPVADVSVAQSQPAMAAASAPAASGVLRSMRYSPRGQMEAIAWQKTLRERLFDAMKMSDLVESGMPLSPKLLSTEDKGKYSLREVEFASTHGRRIKALVTVPLGGQKGQRYPAVVCIHGHSGNRRSVYDANTPYKGFATALAEAGYVTISTDVGQHEVYEQGRTLMGERLWDLIRCVDLLTILPEVDPRRVGCAGLSLGGEMAMWLGAMDTRINATCSCGFLTFMDQLEQNHCKCWKFDGLRELVDEPDIYSLIAPRQLLCQNGLAEPQEGFPAAKAMDAMSQIKIIYSDFGVPNYANLVAHLGGHEVDLPSMMAFFKARLGGR